MQLSQRHQDYWRRNLRLTAVLLVVWASVTFIPVLFAPQFNQLTLFGWPLAFFMGAQGALIAYLIVVVVYARRMDKLDRDCGVEEEY